MFARALIERQRRGCLDPEEVCGLSELDSELRSAGIRIEPYAEASPAVIEDERSLLGRR